MKQEDVMKRKVQTRFWDKVTIQNLLDCWNWTAHVRSRKDGTDPRAIFRVGSKTEYAPRVIWVMVYGEIPKGKCVLHKCDNSKCVNPNHLFLGSQIDNIRDMVNKGRQRGAKGHRNANAKLNADKVLEIKAMLEEQISKSAIARKFGVSKSTIQDIDKQRTWAYIS